MNDKKLDEIIRVTTNYARHYISINDKLTDLGREAINHNFDDYLKRHISKKWQGIMKTYYNILIKN